MLLVSDLSSSLMLFEDEGDSAPDSGRGVESDERCFKMAEAATAAAAALASALMANGDLICKGKIFLKVKRFVLILTTFEFPPAKI